MRPPNILDRQTRWPGQSWQCFQHVHRNGLGTTHRYEESPTADFSAERDYTRYRSRFRGRAMGQELRAALQSWKGAV